MRLRIRVRSKGLCVTQCFVYTSLDKMYHIIIAMELDLVFCSVKIRVSLPICIALVGSASQSVKMDT